MSIQGLGLGLDKFPSFNKPTTQTASAATQSPSDLLKSLFSGKREEGPAVNSRPSAPAPPLQTNAKGSMFGSLFGSSQAASNSSTLLSRGVFVALVLAALVLIVAFVAWLVVRIRRSDRQTVAMMGEITALNRTTVIDKTTLPPTVNGQEFAYGFWVYLQDIDIRSQPKLVMLRSTNVQAPSGGSQSAQTVLMGASPIVFMHASTNRMYISLPTTLSKSDEPATLSQLLSDTGSNKAVTVMIDYVPLQRWVFVAFSVLDNTLTTFVDGDIYSTTTIPELDAGVRPVFRGTRGLIQVGDASNGINGYITKVSFTNYALTHRLVKSMYREGPQLRTLFSRFGLPPYGIRSPIYRIDAVVR